MRDEHLCDNFNPVLKPPNFITFDCKGVPTFQFPSIMSVSKQRAFYIIIDFLAAAISWFFFFSYRKLYIEPLKFGYEIPLEYGRTFFLGLLIIPLFWLLIYAVFGYYKEVLRKSRLSELGNTLFSILSGTIIIFFFFILDDVVSSYRDYYQSFLVLFSVHFLITYFPRIVITSNTQRKIKKGKIFFNALLIGSDRKAFEIFNELNAKQKTKGIRFIGYISINGVNDYFSKSLLNHLGDIHDIENVIRKNHVKEVVIALESTDHSKIEKVLIKLYQQDLIINVIPGLYDILTGRVKSSSILDVPLVQISPLILPAWQENLKMIFDRLIALTALILTLPACIFIAIGIKLSSKGPIIYSHERIGKFGKPFRMYKFRSMIKDAERDGPELSSANDPRVTKFGRFLRKTKLDEIPNFLNVLKGEMSLVGPRPERQFYIDQIKERAPYFVQLLKVKPGITSWGQVKYGYAENVDQMIERLKYDLIYLDNMSLFVDFKIIIYTILFLFRGRNV
jgi:exopolysaccharide biosynthesis polyprenyl glycosylphosphotransferase